MAYPGDWDQEARGRTDEEYRSNPVYPAELLRELASFKVELQSQRDCNESNSNKWQVDVKDPSLRTRQLRATNGSSVPAWLTQETLCAKAPPIIGPVTDPTLHIALMIPNHWPLNRNGIKSVTRISVKAINPPPPIPWNDLPTSSMPKLLDKAATIAPIRKKTRAVITRGLRPKMCEKEAKLGWNIVEVRRKDVPDQKASIAVPLSFCDMI